MKQYSHAWLAFMAIKRLEQAELSKSNRNYADSLIKWFKDHKDGVAQGASALYLVYQQRVTVKTKSVPWTLNKAEDTSVIRFYHNARK